MAFLFFFFYSLILFRLHGVMFLSLLLILLHSSTLGFFSTSLILFACPSIDTPFQLARLFSFLLALLTRVYLLTPTFRS